jgi:class 3 adenylate cyclase
MCDVCSVTDAERQSHRTEIALIGDTMNTAARIQQACRETDDRVLASAAFLDRQPALRAVSLSGPAPLAID